MKKHSYQHRATEEDQQIIQYLDNWIARSIGCEVAGIMRVFRFSIRTTMEYGIRCLASGQYPDVDDFKPTRGEVVKILKADFDEVDWERLHCNSKGFGQGCTQSGEPLKLQHTMRMSLHIAKSWIDNFVVHNKDAEDEKVAECLGYVLAHCSQGGSGMPIGPNAVVSSMVELSRHIEPQQNK